MARFELTAQLKIQGASSSNINSVLGSMQSQLGRGLNVKINVTGAQSAGTQLNRLRQQTQGVTTAIEEMGAAFGASLKRFAAFAVATRAVSIFTNKLGDAIDDAIAFQHEMLRLGQVTGDSAETLGRLAKHVTTLSTSMGISSKEILGVATTLAQAGLSARDTEIALTSLAKTKLAPSFGNIADTTEGAIAIMAQFGEGASALEKQLGSVNQVAAKFAVESQDLIDVIRRSGGVFKASGGSLEELLALFTSVRATTRESAESIATGLRTIFTRIQRPDTIHNLHNLGIELQDVKGKFVGPYEAVRRLSDALKDLPDGSGKFISISEELGGFRQIGKVIPLLQQFELAEKARQVAVAGGNSLDKDAAAAQKSLAVQISKVREEFLALIRDISNTETFKQSTQLLLSMASALIKVGEGLKPLIPLITAFAAVKLTTSIGGIASSIGAGLRRHDGGPIPKFAGGGYVPGSGNGDTVPAMMTPGEYVIKKSSAQKLGPAALHSMNHYGEGSEDGVQPFVPNILKKSIGTKLDPKNKTLREAAAAGLYSRQQLSNPEYGYGPDAVDALLGKAVDSNRKTKGKGAGIKSLTLKPGTVGGLFLQLGEGDKAQTGSFSVDIPAGNPIKGFPGVRNVNGKIDNHLLDPRASKYLTDPLRPILENALKDSIRVAAEKLDVPPLSIKESVARTDVLKNVDLKSIEGHLFEGYLQGLSGSSLSESGATFDFPHVDGKQRERLGKLFSGDPLNAKIYDAKRSLTYKSINGPGSISSKIIAAMRNKKGGERLLTKDNFTQGATQTTFDFEGAQGKAAGGKIFSVSSDNVGFTPKIVQELLGQVQSGTKVNFVIGPAGSGKSTLTSSLGASPLLNPSDINSASSLIFESAAGKIDNITGLLAKARATGGFGILLDKDENIVTAQRQSRVAAKAAGTHSVYDKRSEAALAATSHAPTKLDTAFIETIRGLFPGLEIRKFAQGGTTDSVPAMLTPGEFVINKNSAQKLGYGALNSMNKTGVAHFATGGPVGYADGGGVGGIGLGVGGIFTLLTLINSLNPKVDAFGKAIDALVINLITSATAAVLFYQATRKFVAYAEKISAGSATNRVNTHAGLRDDASTALRIVAAKQANLLTSTAAVPAGRERSQVRLGLQANDLRSRLSEVRARGNPIGNYNEINRLTTLIGILDKALAGSSQRVNDNIRAHLKLRAATEQLTRSQAALAASTTPTKFDIFKNGLGELTGKLGAMANVLSTVTTGVVAAIGVFTAFHDAASQFHANLASEDIASGDFSEAKANIAKQIAHRDKSTILGGGASFLGGAFQFSGIGLGIKGVTGIDLGQKFANKGVGLGREFGGADIADRKLNSEAALSFIQQSQSRSDLISRSKTRSASQKATDIGLAIGGEKDASKLISDPVKQKQVQEEINNGTLKVAHTLFETSKDGDELSKVLATLVDANKELEPELRRAYAAQVAARAAQEALTKVQLDNLRSVSTFGAGALALKNFLGGLETGSSQLNSVINTLHEAETNPFLSKEAHGALSTGFSSARAQLGGAQSPAVIALKNVFDNARKVVDFNKNVGTHGAFTVTPRSPDEAKTELKKQLQGLTSDDEVKRIIEDAVNKSHFNPATDAEPIVKEVQHLINEKLGKGAADVTKANLESQNALVEVTKRRKASEEQFIQVQKHALDLVLESAQAAHEFGDVLVTGADKARITIEKFNVGNDHLKIQGLRGGSAGDILSASQEITAKFSKLQNEVQAQGGAAFLGAGGVDRDKRQELVAKNKELIETTRSLISSKKEELELVRRKNQEEKDSLQKLLSGDVEGFLRGQQSAAAGAAIRSGNTALTSQFSTTALAGALKNAQENGSTPQEVAQVAAVALKSVGITDQRAAQVLSGTTAEEERLNREGRGLSGALGAIGQHGANLEQMNVTTASVLIQAAEVKLTGAVGSAAAQQTRAHGGMVLHAYNGLFVPRGSDTVPAMLTPGEMVMNTRATGAHRNTLEAMNAGGSGAGGVSSEIATMLSNSLSGFSDAVNKLSQMKISVKLDPTNVNVSFTGGSFLQEFTDKVKGELMDHVADKIKSLRQGADGGFSTDQVRPVLS